MLVDVEFSISDPVFKEFLKEVNIDFSEEIQKLDKGIYLGKFNLIGLNFHCFAVNKKDEQFLPYGVSDNVDQILNKHKDLVKDKSTLCFLWLTLVKKSEQSSSGGWRWCKWGEYIGDYEIQCEYLYDESEIDEVIAYSFYEVEKDD